MSAHYKLLTNLSFGILLITTSGCFRNFYKIKTVETKTPAATSESITRFQSQNRYFILRSGDNSFYLNNISLTPDQASLSCVLYVLPTNHQLYITNGPKENFIYKKAKNQAVLKEVHLYIPKEDSIKAGRYTLLTDKVQKIGVIEKDRDRNTMSYISSGVGVSLIAILIFFGIALRGVPG